MTAEVGTIDSARQEEFVGKERRVTFTTLSPGVLCVGAALPDPPFELVDGETPTGFDVELMRAICAELGLEWRLAHYTGKDFNGIFDGLSSGSWDCVASGTTITPERQAVAAFCEPYLQSGQNLVCNIEKTPGVHSIEDLSGMVIGVQHGKPDDRALHFAYMTGEFSERTRIAKGRGNGPAMVRADYSCFAPSAITSPGTASTSGRP